MSFRTFGAESRTQRTLPKLLFWLSKREANASPYNAAGESARRTLRRSSQERGRTHVVEAVEDVLLGLGELAARERRGDLGVELLEELGSHAVENDEAVGVRKVSRRFLDDAVWIEERTPRSEALCRRRRRCS